MSRLVYGMMFLFGLTVCSFTVGCGESNTVIEETRSEAEIEQADADYEAEMEAAEKESVSKGDG